MLTVTRTFGKWPPTALNRAFDTHSCYCYYAADDDGDDGYTCDFVYDDGYTCDFAACFASDSSGLYIHF